MIGMALAMVRARPGPAFTALLLAALAMAAAVSAPVYTVAADRAVIASQVAAAPADELAVQARREAAPDDRAFEDAVPKLFNRTGFTRIFSTETDAMITSPDPVDTVVPRLVYRDDVCAHLRLTAGRCFASETEVVLGADTVERLKLSIGDTLTVRYAVYSPTSGWLPAGPPSQFTLVGVFEPLDPAERYWSDLGYFDTRPTDRQAISPMFANRLTIVALQHAREKQTLDAVVNGDAVTDDSLRELYTAALDGEAILYALPGRPVLRTGLPALRTRIEANQRLVRHLVSVAAVPLVLLCWFVLFVAVASAAQHRRMELGLLALRGVSAPRRWWLAAGESIVAILAGTALGFFLGTYLVRLAARLLLSTPAGAPLAAGLTWWALVAVAGTIVAALLALRADLAKPAADLLRNVPGRLSRWSAPVFETVMVVVAVVAVVQLRQGGQGLTGVAAFGPSAVVIAAGLLAARAVPPVAEWAGRRAMRRGRIGTVLAAYAISRRPGSQRVLALFVVAIAMPCFAATASGAAGDARDRRVRVELGAPRVLVVEPTGRAALLSKVRAIDPAGAFAMAAAPVPLSDETGAPPMLAVDSRRLARVALWDDSRVTAAQAAELLHPAARAPVVVDDGDLALDVTVASTADAFRVRWTAVVVPLDGSPSARVSLGEVRLGRHTYTRNLPVCGAGCRLAALQVDQPEGRGFDISMTLHGLRQNGTVIADEAGFAAPGAWRVPESSGPKLLVPALDRRPDGLHARVADYRGADVTVRIMPADAPSPIPVVTARNAAIGDHITGFDGLRLTVARAAEVDAVPQLGFGGGLIDLEYADRLAADGGEAIRPQVWLGAAAPSDVLDRVRAQGLRVVSDRAIGPLRDALDKQGPAVALRFHELAGGFAVVLATGALWMVASLDRRRRSHESRRLRTQGVTRRDAAASGYLALTGAAALIGPVAALAGWLLVRQHLPVFTDDPGPFAVPLWPPPLPVALAWVASALPLIGAAAVAARLRRP